MSDAHRNQEALLRELFAELEGPEREAIDRLSELEGAERRRLERLDAELVGLLPCALPPARPRPALRDALLAAATGRGPAAAAPPRVAAREPVGRRWLLPLAASLAAAGLALAGLLAARLEGQRQAVARLEAEVAELRRATDGLAASERAARSQLAVVGSPGVEVCALRPRQASPLGGEPWGVLYVAADHEHWYLALHGLLPCPQGRVYQVWFMAPDGPVSAGTFRPEHGAPIELSSEQMPAGTSAIKVTLEPPGGASAPSGPEILFGDEPIRTL